MHSPATRCRRLGSDPSAPAPTPIVSADEAGRHGRTRSWGAFPHPTIQPVDGWTLMVMDEEDGDRFVRPSYFARRGAEEIALDVSRFHFMPTQERFAWFVRRGFPARPSLKGGWYGSEVDAALLAERVQVAA